MAFTGLNQMFGLLVLCSLVYTGSSQITGLAVTSKTDTEVVVSWTITGCTSITGVYDSGGGDTNINGLTNSSTTTTITGLSACTDVTIKITCDSNPEETVTTKTTPPTATNLVVANVDKTMDQTVTWTDATQGSCGALTYRLEIVDASASGITQAIAVTSPFTVHNTVADTTIGYSLFTADGNNESAPATFSATTNPATKPTVTQRTDVALTVTWALPGAGCDSITLEYSTTPVTTYTAVTPALGNTETTKEITGLTTCTDYEVKITCVKSGTNDVIQFAEAKTRPPVVTNTSLTNTADELTQVLTWDAVTAGSCSSITYKVIWGEDGGTLITSPVSAATFTTVNLDAITYYEYTVYTVTADDESLAATTLNGTTNYGAPLTVTGLSDTGFTVEWTLPTDGCTSIVFTYEKSGSPATTLTPAPQPTDTSSALTGLDPCGEYSVVLSCEKTGKPTAVGKVTKTTVPPAATGVTLVNVDETTHQTLTWTDPTAAGCQNLQAMVVWQKGSDPEHKLVASSPHTFTQLEGNTEYSYKVVMENDGYVSADSASLTGTTNPADPPTVTNLAAESLTLTWILPGGGCDSIALSHVSGGQPAVTVSGVANTATTSSVPSLAACTEYEFTVTCTKANVPDTNQKVTAKTLPATPTSLSVDNVAASTAQTISYLFSAPACTSPTYKIYFRRTSETKNKILLVSALSKTIDYLTQNESYTYAVSAVSGGVESALTSEVAETTNDVAPGPATVTLSNITDTSFDVTWPLPAAGCTAITLEYKLQADANYTQLSPAPSSTDTTASLSGLTACSTYDVKVTCTGTPNTVMEGGGSTKPPQITTISGTNVDGSTSQTLTWTMPTAVTCTAMETQVVWGISTSQARATIVVTGSTYTFEGLNGNTLYQYKLTVYNNNAHGLESAPYTATTNDPENPPTVTLLTTTSYTIDWTLPTATCDSVGVTESVDGGTATSVSGVSPTQTQLVVSSKDPCTSYAYVITCTKANTADVVSKITVTTKVPKATGVTVVSSGRTQDVTWTFSQSSCTTPSYLVRYKKTADTEVSEIPSTTASIQFQNLSGVTEYTYTVIVISENQRSEESDPGTGTTTASSLVNADNPTIDRITDLGFRVTWSLPTAGCDSQTLTTEESGSSAVALSPAPGASDTTADITGLTTCTEYTVTVTCVKSGESDVVYTTTTKTIPSKPTNLAVTNVTDKTDQNVTWDFSAATCLNPSYKIFQLKAGETLEIYVIVTDKNFTFEDLDQDTGYTYRAMTQVDGVFSESTASVSEKTNDVSPSREDGLTYSDLTDTSVKVSWNNPQAGCASITATTETGGSPAVTVSPAPTASDTELTISGLTPCTEYTIKVTCNETNASPVIFSNVILTKPPTPTNLAVANVANSTSQTLTWDGTAASCTNLRFRAFIGTDPVVGEFGTDYLTVRTFTFDDLLEGTRYDYRVVSYDGDNEGDSSATFSATTNVIVVP